MIDISHKTLRHSENILCEKENMRIADRFFAVNVLGGWALSTSPITCHDDRFEEGALAEGFAKAGDSCVERVEACKKYREHVQRGGRNRARPLAERFHLVSVSRKAGLWNILSDEDASALSLDTTTKKVNTRLTALNRQSRYLNSPDVLAALTPFEVMRRNMSQAFLTAMENANLGTAKAFSEMQSSMRRAGAILAAVPAAPQLPPPDGSGSDQSV